MNRFLFLCLGLFMTPAFAAQPDDTSDDPHRWLEDVKIGRAHV
jgi:hypothetical protein